MFNKLRQAWDFLVGKCVRWEQNPLPLRVGPLSKGAILKGIYSVT